ncbi:MAG: orotidine-5'-phosphate decarboxylase [Acidimicrobiales bacterium]
MAGDLADLSAGAPEPIRSRMALALDVDDLVEARRIARLLRPWFGVAKVGLELFSAAGPQAIEAMISEGFDVFADLKLLDIPTTVNKAAYVMGSLGVTYLTVHSRAGVDHLRAGVDGVAAGAATAGLGAPLCLGITVLTSERADLVALEERVGVVLAAGCGGLVCSASDLSLVRSVAPNVVAVVPGIRPAGVGVNDQARPATPTLAIESGADVLVIGRAVTHAEDPVMAAIAIATEVAGAVH